MLASLVVLASPATFAVNRAVIINFGSIGVGLDTAAIKATRHLIGFAVANGTVDNFAVPKVSAGTPIPIEGGFTACAEAHSITDGRFNAFIQELKSIKPKSGTVYSVTLTATCDALR
ncbi:hypothetical protein [Methyloglobulus sp.]|uniref:hypothetical protein n=1 Tax=Methyloglobulus sp. TaxID=2518622 RepID=UPI0032B73EC2